MNSELKRCWSTDDPLYIKYHDEEWGVPVHEDSRLFGFLILESFQEGFSWIIMLKKREAFNLSVHLYAMLSCKLQD
jgi:DNA-3-methyladenine glycosylase I